MSLALAEGEQTLAQTAAEMLVNPDTLRAWAARWTVLGVVGVRRVPNRRGHTFVFARDFVPRWLACEIPSPNDAA